MVDRLNRSVFSDVLGSTFRLHLDEGGTVDLELIEASELKRQADTVERDPFSLVLRGPKDTILPQQIYTFEHDTIGQFGMFIVPIGPDDTGMLYEAVFN